MSRLRRSPSSSSTRCALNGATQSRRDRIRQASVDFVIRRDHQLRRRVQHRGQLVHVYVTMPAGIGRPPRLRDRAIGPTPESGSAPTSRSQCFRRRRHTGNSGRAQRTGAPRQRIPASSLTRAERVKGRCGPGLPHDIPRQCEDGVVKRIVIDRLARLHIAPTGRH